MATFLSNGTLSEETQTIVSSASLVYLTVDTPTIIHLTGSVAQSFRLASARKMVPGIRFFIGNRTAQQAIVQNYDSSQLAIIVPNSQIELRLLTNASANGAWDVAFAGGGVIGDAEDSDYSDGLFPDFTSTTPIGTTVDRFNEVLKQLAPPPAPTLAAAALSASGPATRLSWDGSHIIAGYTPVGTAAGNAAVLLNGLYSPSGTRYGAFGLSSRFGTLASGVAAQAQGSYPANAFGNADTGTLTLKVNGVTVQTVNLSTFGSGSAVNANGSGFTLSAATPVQFPNASTFLLFKYRTGTFTVATADQGLGFNYAQVVHTFNGSDHITNFMEWVADSNASALSASSGAIGSLAMTAVRYLSGVAYHTAGTASYSAQLANAQKNLYADGSVVTFPGTSCSASSQSLTAVGSPDYENAVLSVVAPLTVATGARILNGSFTMGISCTHPLKSTLSNAAQATVSGILLDAMQTASTDIHETFDTESIRLRSVAYAGVNAYAAQADVASGTWDSTVNLISGASGYADGLLYYSGLSCYPTRGANGGNFGTITNGPAGNPDYSGAAGVRWFYLKFRNNSGSTRANLRLVLTGTGSFVSAASGASGQNLTLEMKFPTGSISSGTGWMDCYGDFATGQWGDGAGCRLASQGNGQAFGVNWGLTLGTKSLAANEYLVFRVSAASAWTGSVSDIALTFL